MELLNIRRCSKWKGGLGDTKAVFEQCADFLTLRRDLCPGSIWGRGQENDFLRTNAEVGQQLPRVSRNEDLPATTLLLLLKSTKDAWKPSHDRRVEGTTQAPPRVAASHHREGTKRVRSAEAFRRKIDLLSVFLHSVANVHRAPRGGAFQLRPWPRLDPSFGELRGAGRPRFSSTLPSWSFLGFWQPFPGILSRRDRPNLRNYGQAF